MSEPKSRIEIIDFIVSHFENNPRSLSESGDCLYNGPNGSHCAFAIMCSNPEKLPEGKGVFSLIQKRIPKIKPEFAGYSTGFYRDIQSLHDYDGNWIKTPEGNELTLLGVKEVERLKYFHK